MHPLRSFFALFAVVLLIACMTATSTSAQVTAPQVTWKASPPVSDCVPPVDPAGHHWDEPEFDDSAWSPVTLPDESIGAGQTRLYRGHVELPGQLPQAALQLSWNAGSMVYANSEYVGRWGSDCGTTSGVPGEAEIDLTPFLKTGSNLIALQGDAGPNGGRLGAVVRTGAGKVWTPYRGNPVVDVRLSGNWDAAAVGSPSILHEADGYRMWYTGRGEEPQIGLAVSDDGIYWRAVGDQPVLRPGAAGEWDSEGVSSPSVVRMPDGYHMVYTGWDGQQRWIGFATSGDGITWIKHGGPVVKPGGGGAFDSKGQHSPSLDYDGRWYRMWYVGTGDDGKDRIGLALSMDGVVWLKHPQNPVLDQSAGYYRTGVDEPAVVRDAEGWVMWYEMGGYLFRATSTDGIAWMTQPEGIVLGPGNARSWDDSRVGAPSAIVDEGGYSMWFTGNDARIGVASSPDGIHWQPRPSAVLEQRAGMGYWDEWSLGRATVMHDEDGYRMWYSAHYGYFLIEEATSVDGITWDRKANNIVLRPGPKPWDSVEVFSPRVLRAGEGQDATLHMWYSGWDRGPAYRIGHATSSDNGATWQKSASNPVIDVGPEGAWDSHSVQGASVLTEGDSFRTWYMGQDGTSWQIGMATSPDGDHWTKYEGNPVMSPTSPGRWDGRHIYWINVIRGGPGYQMWYSATDSATGLGPIRIGYAESVDGIRWDRDAENPVSIPRPAGWWGQPDVFEPFVIREVDVYRMWYTERNAPGLYRLNYAWSAIQPGGPAASKLLYLPLTLSPGRAE